MEDLTEKQQETIRKMSSARIINKLLGAGTPEADIDKMSRQELLTAWAKCVAAGKETAEKGAEGGGTEQTAESVEAQRIELERWKFQQELASREQERQDRLRKEEQELAARLRREEQELRKEEQDRVDRLERERRERDDRLDKEEKERELEARKLDIQGDIEKIKLAQTEQLADSRIALLKKFGDAVKYAMGKQPEEPAENIAYFRRVTATFDLMKIPPEFRSDLIMPYLNAKSRAIVARLDPEKAQNFDALCEIVLAEYRLSPTEYANLFNTTAKLDSETYTMFCNKLKAYLQQYLDSRHIDNSFRKLVDLLLCDRVKSTLSPACLRHVLALENVTTVGWLDSDNLTISIDRYLASCSSDGKPRTESLGGAHSNHSSSRGNGRKPKADTAQVYNTSTKPAAEAVGLHTRNTDKSADSKAGNAQGAPKKLKCHRCGKWNHIAKYCRTILPEDKRGPADTAKANLCILEPQGASENLTPSPREKNCEPITVIEHTLPDCDSLHSCALKSSVQQPVQLSSLKHVSVYVNELGFLHPPISALEDSGSEITVIRSSLVKSLNLPTVGKVNLRGIVGNSFPVPLVELHLSMCSNANNRTFDSMPVLCAVCEQLNEELIVPTSLVDKLQTFQATLCNTYTGESEVSTYAAETVVENSCLKREGGGGEEIALNDEFVSFNDSVRPAANQASETEVDPNERLEQKRDFDAESVMLICESVGAELEPPHSTAGEEGLSSEAATDPQQAQESTVDVERLIVEQQSDDTLKPAFKMFAQGRGSFFMRNGLLYRKGHILGQTYDQLCLPKSRRDYVLELGHSTLGTHFNWKRTRQRIALSFFWFTMTKDAKAFCKFCSPCQRKRRITKSDRVPITPVDRPDTAFEFIYADVFGPIIPDDGGKTPRFALTTICAASKWPNIAVLRNPTAKTVCDAFLQMWCTTGCPRVVVLDNASYFSGELTQEFLRRFGCSPRFITPYHPQANAAERGLATIKQAISKVAADCPKKWHTMLGPILWAIREQVHSTTHVSPYQYVYGRVPTGFLTVLRDYWTNGTDTQVRLGKSTTEYLKGIEENLKVAQKVAQECTEIEQQ